MLTIKLPSKEYYDNDKNEFILTKQLTIQLEHSLVSISKWESKWKVAFLSKEEHSVEQTKDYIKSMIVTPNIEDDVVDRFDSDDINKIKEYIDDSMTAAKLPIDRKGGSREVITSDVIYYWMVALNIPFDCQKWHLNRLLTLINICNIKNAPPKKMGKKEILSRNASINAARKEALQSKG
jgi:hypothetical protein